ncbi:MAG: hypothetical protein ACUVWN_04610 [bacterium]
MKRKKENLNDFSETLVYKVTNSNQQSIWAVGRAQVQYSDQKWTHAPFHLAKKGYHLYAFDTFENALRFTSSLGYRMGGKYEIWEAMARGLIKDLPPMLNLVDIEWDIEWEGNNFRESSGQYSQGTIMCKEIRLLGKIIELIHYRKEG